MRKRWAWVLGLAVVGAGCVGAIGSGDGEQGGGAPAGPGGGTSQQPITCDPNAVPDSVPLRRLSRSQYENTVRDLVRELVPADATAVLGTVAAKLERLPDDRRTAVNGDTHGGFRRLDQVVNQEHVDATYDVAVALGRALTGSSARLAAIAGACASDSDPSNDDACLDAVIRKVGALAQRRPLADEDVAFYRSIAGTEKVSGAALADVLGAILASPRFLYHVEHASTGDAFAPLDAWELAVRLSYHFWQTMPDAELRASAASGALLTEDGWTKQVHRLFADPRTEATLDAFVREWLWLDEVPRMDGRVGDAVFDAFAGEDRPTADLHLQMVDDVLAAARATTTSGGAFADLFTDAKSYAKGDALAKIYGVSPWTSGPGPTAANRVGLLTRPAFLATGSANTRPIMKGVFIRKALLCDEIPPPPNNAAAMAPPPGPTQTTREFVEQLTEKPGTACAACHANLINPLGFATEDYDALGRHRTAQKLYDDAGNLVGEKAVSTKSVPKIETDDLRESEGAADLTKLLLESGKVQSCFARQWFRFTFVRAENGKDGCLLEDVVKGANEGRSFAEVLMRVALRPEFKRRSF